LKRCLSHASKLSSGASQSIRPCAWSAARTSARLISASSSCRRRSVAWVPRLCATRSSSGADWKIALLEMEPRYSYDLIREIETRTGGVYAPSPAI
jgi:hypothetical protein